MSSPRLHLVMPVIRPLNMPQLILFYLVGMDPHPFELRWHLMVQGPDADPKGIHKANEAIGFIQDGWVVTFSDDTTQDRSLFKRLGEVIKEHPECTAVVFSQKRLDGTVLHAHPDNMHPCHVSGDQILWRHDLLNQYRFDYEAHAHECDGYLIEQVYREKPDHFVFIDEVLGKFGSLEW